MTDAYTTSASGTEGLGRSFTGPMTDVARWTDNAGLRGLLVFTDNESVDVWSAAQFMIERTRGVAALILHTPRTEDDLFQAKAAVHAAERLAAQSVRVAEDIP